MFDKEFFMLLCLPQAGIAYMSKISEIGIDGMNHISITLGVLMFLVCSFQLLLSVGVEDENAGDMKGFSVSAFAVYILLNIGFYGVIYYHKAEITDINMIYQMGVISTIQIIICLYFLGNNFSKKNDEKSEVNITNLSNK